MIPLTNKSFAEPAAFVARLVRRHGLRHFLFTSARNNEGTTTTVLGIARELHSSYALRVLVLEINPHAGGFMTALELEQYPIDYTSEASFSTQDIRPLPVGFSIMSLGRQQKGSKLNGNSIDLLGELLKVVGEYFDVVLIDSPPVLDGPEVLIAGPEVDGVVLVVEAGRTRVEMLEHMRSIFIREGLNILGSVLTKQEHAIPNWFYRILFK